MFKRLMMVALLVIAPLSAATAADQTMSNRKFGPTRIICVPLLIRNCCHTYR